MALINCKKCGKQISNKASTCIHCGYPIKQINYKLIILDTIFVITFTISIFSRRFFSIIYIIAIIILYFSLRAFIRKRK